MTDDQTLPLFDARELETPDAARAPRRVKAAPAKTAPPEASLFGERMTALCEMSDEQQDRIWDSLENSRVARSPRAELLLSDMVFAQFGLSEREVETYDRRANHNGHVYETLESMAGRLREMGFEVRPYKPDPDTVIYWRLYGPVLAA